MHIIKVNMDRIKSREKIKDLFKDYDECGIEKTIKRLPGESFKIIPGFSKYLVSNKGRLITVSKGSEKLLAIHPIVNKTGKSYATCWIVSDYSLGHTRTFIMMNRLVGYVWLGLADIKYNPETTFVVDHINGDTLDNSTTNLQVITQSKNILKCVTEGKKIKPIELIDEDGNVIKRYTSSVDFMKQWGLTNPGVPYTYINRHYKFKGKFYLRYTNSEK